MVAPKDANCTSFLEEEKKCNLFIDSHFGMCSLISTQRHHE